MGISDVAVALMVIYVQSVSGKLDIFSGQSFSCNNYTDVVMKEWYCRPIGLFTISDDVMNDGILTREELLEEVHKQCSNETRLEIYFDCLEDFVVECPVQSVPFLDVIEDKLEMFCDGNNVSEWLLTTVQSGYSFNQECMSVSMELMAGCAREISASLQQAAGGNVNLTTALKLLPQAISDLFQCTENAFLRARASSEECGSSWQDILLTMFLVLSSRSGLGGHLPYEDRLRLQALTTGQTIQ